MILRLVGTDKQREIVEAQERFLFAAAGRRWGKTVGICRNRILSRCSIPDFQYWYIAPVYAQIIEQFNAIAAHPGLQNYIHNTKLQPYPCIWFTNGSYVAFRTFERPRNLRGSGLNEVWCDEIQDYEEREFWPVIRPLISDKRGNLVCSGQFRGKNWYYHQLYLPGTPDHKHPDYRSWRLPSSSGLVFQSEEGKAELELVKTQIPKAVYDQEYECIPVANAASVFDPVDLETIQSGKNMSGGAAGSRYIVALDLGRVADPSAIVVIDIKRKQVVHSERRQLKERHEVTAPYVSKLAEKFGGAAVLCDVTGGATGGKVKDQDAYVRHYRKAIKNLREIVWSHKLKNHMVSELVLAIEQHQVTIPEENSALLGELGLYEFEYKNGIYRYHGPKGHTDDLVAALLMAWYGVVKGYGPAAGGHSLNDIL